MQGDWHLEHFAIGERVWVRRGFDFDGTLVYRLGTVVKITRNQFGRVSYRVQMDRPLFFVSRTGKGCRTKSNSEVAIDSTLEWTYKLPVAEAVRE